jgi:hypothetical protein
MSVFMLSSLGRIDVAYGAITASASGYDLITSAAATSESGLCRLRGKPSCPGENLVACRTARRSAANARRDEADASDARHAGDRRRQRVVATHPLKGFSAIDPGGPVAATDRLRYLLRSVAGGEHRAARLRKLRRVIAKTGNDAIDIRYLRATEPHDIRRAGHLLLHGAAIVLRDRRACADEASGRQSKGKDHPRRQHVRLPSMLCAPSTRD